MQSTKQVENIVQSKLEDISNKKVIEDMQTAIDDIQQEKQMDKRYAIIGLLIIIPSITYLVVILFSK